MPGTEEVQAIPAGWTEGWLGRAQSGGGSGAHTLPWGVAVQRVSERKLTRPGVGGHGQLPTPAPVHSLRGGAVPEGGRPGPCGVPVLRLEPVSDSISEPRLVGAPTLPTPTGGCAARSWPILQLRLPGLGSVLPSGHLTHPSCTRPRPPSLPLLHTPPGPPSLPPPAHATGS